MNTQLYIQCFLISLLGMAFSIIMQIRALMRKSRAAKEEFSVWTYFKQDWLSGVASIFFIAIVLVVISEVLKWKPWVIDYIKIVFVLVGYLGADLGYKLFSATSKKITKIIADKTAEPISDK